MSSVNFLALGNAASNSCRVIVIPSLFRRYPSPLSSQNSYFRPTDVPLSLQFCEPSSRANFSSEPLRKLLFFKSLKAALDLGGLDCFHVALN